MTLRDTSSIRFGVLGLVLGILFAPAARALPYFVSIQPIQVCTDVGVICANPTREVFQAATNAIWAQAGVEVRFDDWTVLNSTQFYHLTTGQEFADLFSVPGVKDPNPLTLNMFFVQDINASSSHWGEAMVGSNGVVIGSAAVLNSNRIDTIAHEIGHNLGLTHTGYGAGGSNNLMTNGGARSVPGTVGDIAPDGLGLDFLTALQIDKVLTSMFVRDNPDYVPPEPPPEETPVSAPGALAPMAAGALVCVFLLRRRREAA